MMMYLGIGIVAFIAIVAFAMVAGRPRATPPERHMPPAGGKPQPLNQPVAADGEEPAWMVDVRNALAANRKIEAIKLYREATGAGLAEAKAAVEQTATNRPPAESKPQPLNQPAAADGEEPAWMVDVRNALAANRKIEAIKLYREASGAGLAEAKAAVERLEN